MENKKQATYSIYDAFKSLDMIEDETVVITKDTNIKSSKILSENMEEKEEVIENEEELKDEDMEEIDRQIEELNRHLFKLKETYDKNPSKLTEKELTELRESGLIEIENETSITEEQKINVADKKEVEQGIEILNKEKDADEIEMVVDVDAETKEELKDSYVGNFILQCQVCKTLIYKDEKDVIRSDEDDDIVNVEEECPHCKSEEGYTIVGKVAPVSKDEESEDVDSENDEEDSEEDTSKDEVEKEVKDKETEEDEVEQKETEEDDEEKNESLSKQLLTIDIEDLNESLFNKLATKYLNNIYENVNDFTTMSGSIDEDKKIVIEGTINFKSGKKLNTKFIFEAKNITKKGRIRFVGMNESLSNSKRTFMLVGRLTDSVLLPESLTYNYSVKINEELKRVYGRVTEDLSKLIKK